MENPFSFSWTSSGKKTFVFREGELFGWCLPFTARPHESFRRVVSTPAAPAFLRGGIRKTFFEPGAHSAHAVCAVEKGLQPLPLRGRAGRSHLLKMGRSTPLQIGLQAPQRIGQGPHAECIRRDGKSRVHQIAAVKMHIRFEP